MWDRAILRPDTLEEDLNTIWEQLKDVRVKESYLVMLMNRLDNGTFRPVASRHGIPLVEVLHSLAAAWRLNAFGRRRQR